MSEVQETDQLILNNLHLIPKIASMVKRTLVTADQQELESSGYFALVKAARKYQGINGCSFTVYMYTCVRGQMYRDFARPDGHRNYHLQKWMPIEKARFVPALTPSPFKMAAQREKEKRVHEAIEKLKPKHIKILNLVFFEEMDMKMIADKWEIKYGKATKIFLTAKNAFRVALLGGDPYRRTRFDAAEVNYT